MRDQLYRGYANATALSNSPVVSALGSGLRAPVVGALRFEYVTKCRLFTRMERSLIWQDRI